MHDFIHFLFHKKEPALLRAVSPWFKYSFLGEFCQLSGFLRVDRDSESVQVAVVTVQGLDHDDLVCRRDVRPRAFSLRQVVIARVADSFLELGLVNGQAVNSIKYAHDYFSDEMESIVFRTFQKMSKSRS